MKCWGKVRDKGACRRNATTWCLVKNVQFAMCDRHAGANEGKALYPMGAPVIRSSTAR